MEKIKTNRINGCLNLNTYFNKRLKRKFTDIEELYIKGLIEYEPTGINDKFWILSEKGDKIALYKVDAPNTDESYVELLVEEIAHIMDIPTAHYDLAMFNGKKGVISYSFLKDGISHLSGFDIIDSFYSDKLQLDEQLSSLYNIDYNNDSIDEVCYKLNNLQDIWTILEDRFQDNPNKAKIVKSIMDGFVNKLILDVVVVGVDSHCDNWEIIDEKYLAPVFDNSRALGMHTKFKNSKVNENMKIQDSELLFTVDEEKITKPLEILDYFLKISSSEYKDVFIEKVNKLKDNFKSIPLKIEERTNYPMPNYLKDHFINELGEHLEKINEVVNNKGTQK